jgi:hypothetical protein
MNIQHNDEGALSAGTNGIKFVIHMLCVQWVEELIMTKEGIEKALLTAIRFG